MLLFIKELISILYQLIYSVVNRHHRRLVTPFYLLQSDEYQEQQKHSQSHFMADQANSSQVDDPRDALEKRISDSVRMLFEILGRPSRQNVLYAKDKKELKQLSHQIMTEL